MLTSTFGNELFLVRQRSFEALDHLVEARGERRRVSRTVAAGGDVPVSRSCRRGRIQPVYRLIQPLKRLAQPVRNIRQFAFPATSLPCKL